MACSARCAPSARPVHDTDDRVPSEHSGGCQPCQVLLATMQSVTQCQDARPPRVTLRLSQLLIPRSSAGRSIYLELHYCINPPSLHSLSPAPNSHTHISIALNHIFSCVASVPSLLLLAYLKRRFPPSESIRRAAHTPVFRWMMGALVRSSILLRVFTGACR